MEPPKQEPNANPAAPPQQQTASQAAANANVPKPLDTKPEEKKKSLNIKPRIEKSMKIIKQYQVPIIALAITGLLSITALRMMHYASPAANEARIQENLKNFKQVRIDQKVVDQIKSLKTSNSKPKTDIEAGRTNPFSE
jgi:hypothetical protein